MRERAEICGGGGFVTPPGVTPTGSLSGVVFTDTNGNGTQDSGEPGVGGVTVTVTGSDNTPHTTTTDSSGNFTVTDLPPGTYTVTVTPPTGTFVDQPTVTVSGNQTTTVPIAEVPQSTVTGTVTTNGQPVAGVTVTVTGTNNEGQMVTSQAITSGNGTFSFTLPPGTFTISAPTTFNGSPIDSPSTITVTTTAGVNPPSISFTYVGPPALSCVAATTGQVGIAYNSSRGDGRRWCALHLLDPR